MEFYNEIEGDLIELSLKGHFNCIVHGCNCQNKMRSGIAKEMVKNFQCDKFPLEAEIHKGNINKLGQIDYKKFSINTNDLSDHITVLTVINLYSQFNYGSNYLDGTDMPLDYEALTLGLRKINHIFPHQKIGIPGLIGCGLAKGNPDIVKKIIKKELNKCYAFVVYLNK
jgi:O-acetyl-ADP-ribose deacetylase (regulator of RNase III)